MRNTSSFIWIISLTGLILLAGIFFDLHWVKAEIAADLIVNPVDGLITDENGATASFTVQLDSEPANHVTLDLTSSNPAEGLVSPEKIQINRNKWDEIFQVEVSGVADSIEDGDVLYQITGTTSSIDPDFDGLVMPAVYITNLNDPVPIANDDFPPISGYSPITIPVLDNDSALIDLPIEISVISDPSFGTYTIESAPDNTITYTPLQTFLGVDKFTYMICDQDNDCSTADVVIEDGIAPEIVSITPAGIGGTYEVSIGEIIIEVEVTDNFQVDCVGFIRWDALGEQFIDLGEDCDFPFQVTIESSSLNYGWNQIYIWAVDIAGNSTQHEFIWLYRVNRTYIPLIISP